MIKQITLEVQRHLGWFGGVLKGIGVKMLGFVISVWVISTDIGIAVGGPVYLTKAFVVQIKGTYAFG